jgi:hypothetical protein
MRKSLLLLAILFVASKKRSGQNVDIGYTALNMSAIPDMAAAGKGL